MISLLVLMACSSLSTPDVPSQLPGDLKGLQLVEKEFPNVLYVRDGGTTVADYTDFYIPEIRVIEQFNQTSQLSDSQTQELTRYFYTKLNNELKSAGLNIVESPTSTSMSINIGITDINAPISLSSKSAARIQSNFEFGSVAIVAGFANSKTNRVDALAVHLLKGKSMFSNEQQSSYQDIIAAFDIWSKNVAEAIINAKR